MSTSKEIKKQKNESIMIVGNGLVNPNFKKTEQLREIFKGKHPVIIDEKGEYKKF
ncbi:hypothetical protein ABES38_08955 [Bacillus gobiensis]|uniref:hypothetical protein n=1 Tax=Bacillus gobiensis TaxID=1441095 RepID=UPI003D25AAD9